MCIVRGAHLDIYLINDDRLFEPSAPVYLLEESMILSYTDQEITKAQRQREEIFIIIIVRLNLYEDKQHDDYLGDQELNSDQQFPSINRMHNPGTTATSRPVTQPSSYYNIVHVRKLIQIYSSGGLHVEWFNPRCEQITQTDVIGT